jgi:GntR family transcriptional regulator
MTNPNALPIYVQTAEMLIREIAAGRILEGERLPPERDMAKDLGISVGTLRKALADLTGKGYLDRVQGSGNYVRHPPEAAGVYAFLRIELAEGGGLPTAEMIDVRRLPKPGGFPAFGPSSDGHRFRRLRRLGGVPAALEEIWLDASHAEGIEAADLSESLYLFYRERLGLWITRAEDRVGVGQVPDWRVAPFPLRAGATCGFIERLSWGQDGRTCEYSRTWFDPDKMRYISRMK